jgi:hypothetical protein
VLGFGILLWLVLLIAIFVICTILAILAISTFVKGRGDLHLPTCLQLHISKIKVWVVVIPENHFFDMEWQAIYKLTLN